jgi:hypothetical protein
MQFEYNEKDRPWDGQFVSLPDGLYDVTATEAGDDADQNNNMRFKIVFRIDSWVDAPKGSENEHTGKEVNHYLRSGTDAARKRAMHFMNQCGLQPVAGKPTNITSSDVVGKRFRVRCSQFVPKQPDGSAGRPMPMFSEERILGEAQIRVA